MNKMVNPNLIKLAKRTGNGDLPKEEIPKEEPKTEFSFSEYSKAMFLEGDFGQEILLDYLERVQGQYQNASALDVLKFADNVVKGSNLFAFVLLNHILREKNMRIATPRDLEKILKNNELDLKGTYGDSALVLRSDGDPNSYLAGKLIEEVKQNNGSIEYPTMIPLAGLELEYDSGSPHNLSFRLGSNSQIIYAPQLDNSNNGKKFSEGDEKGLPVFNDNGSRTLYTGSDGLRRLYRNRYLDLNAWNVDLASSNSDGRVVVCAEGTRSNS
jgi:hypothetical protein